MSEGIVSLFPLVSSLIILILIHDDWPLLLWLPSTMGQSLTQIGLKKLQPPYPLGMESLLTQIKLFTILQAMNRGTLSFFPQPTLDCAGLFRIWFDS